MKNMLNWRGETIEIANSKGGTLAVINPYDNLITTGISPWPPPEIIQKLYQSYHIRDFEGQNRKDVTKALNYYSDLQSIHSEDAITWNVFGTLSYADQSAKSAFAEALFDLLRIPDSRTIGNVSIWLWRRIPHPDTLTSAGPEIDFGIQTEQVVILGEAKWLSDVGRGQGKAGDKNQIILRREFFEKYGKAIFGEASHYVALSLSISGGLLKNEELDLGYATLYLRDTTWELVSSLKGHPQSTEIQSYLKWKKENSKVAR